MVSLPRDWSGWKRRNVSFPAAGIAVPGKGWRKSLGSPHCWRGLGSGGQADLCEDLERYFIPSPFWRKIREGITSTARFHGMLFLGGQRLVVYHIGDGNMDWQLFAERSLFFQNYGRYDDRATGMLLICDNGIGPEIAGNIIRDTMSRRKRLLTGPGSYYYETDKPQKYSRQPIRLHDQYSRAFFTEEQDLKNTLNGILQESMRIDRLLQNLEGSVKGGKDFWDVEQYPDRHIFNPANDLFKYLYLFANLRDYPGGPVKWHLHMPSKYAGLVETYRSSIEVKLWE